MLSRRTFMQTFGYVSGALTLAASWPGAAAVLKESDAALTDQATALTAWVRITPANEVTLLLSQAEIGQGIATTLPAILADELGADWSTINLLAAPFAPDYRNPRINFMFTGNSESIQSFHDLMRRVGAAAREMLVTAAARRWQVPASECTTENSVIVHRKSGRQLTFGAVARQAAQLQVPRQPKLKANSELRLAGRSLDRIDVPAKVDGSAVFGIDFALPGMLNAAVRTAPAIGGDLRSMNEAAAMSTPGVVKVVRIPNGAAVVADTYWNARRGLARLDPQFDAGPHSAVSSDSLAAEYLQRLSSGPFVTPIQAGNLDAALARATRVVTLDYANPFLAHATLEPMNCVADVTAAQCRIFAPTQGQELATYALSAALGLRPEQIDVRRSPYIGGGFGRRLVPDFVVQAALISRAVGRPVKTIWDREEDMRRDLYRPATMVRLRAGLDSSGHPVAMHARVVSPTIILPVAPNYAPMMERQGFDPNAMEGMMEWLYDIADRRVEFHLLKLPIPTSVLRGTGYGPNLFALESFIDELAALAGSDPYQYRRALLRGNPRALAVLDRAAALADWSGQSAKGVGRGIAIAHAYGTYIAQVVEAQVTNDIVKLTRVVSVVDCGRVLDPRIARQGIEGGVVFGIAGCKAAVTFAEGRVREENFHRYRLPDLAQTPELVTEFIEGGGPLGGIGEVSPVTVTPALANALYAASGRRLRSLPIGGHGLAFN
ncbi:MAG TPA: molybdopterin cofactor-binding domain-containing protein [Steroidobacteraceae bacterium]|nr:molybdopterin cofactor-binding domain-containing protein [Steroidobacteraceae bacterium]